MRKIAPMRKTVKPQTIPEDLLTLMSEKFRMLGDTTRLAILRCLMTGGEMNVSQIVSSTGRGLANVSKHLKQLADAGLVARRRKGSFVLYRLGDPVVEKICHLVCDSLRREIEAQLAKHRRTLKRTNRE